MTTEQILEFEKTKLVYYPTRGCCRYPFYIIDYLIPYIESNDVKFVRWVILTQHECLKNMSGLIYRNLIPITIKNNYFEIYRLLEPYLEMYLDKMNNEWGEKSFHRILNRIIFKLCLQSQTLDFYNYFVKKYWYKERRSIHDSIIKRIRKNNKRYERFERCINKRYPLPLNDGIIDF